MGLFWRPERWKKCSCRISLCTFKSETVGYDKPLEQYAALLIVKQTKETIKHDNRLNVWI